MNIAPISERSELLSNIKHLRLCIATNDLYKHDGDDTHLHRDLAINLHCLFHGGEVADGTWAHIQGFIPQWIYDLAR